MATKMKAKRYDANMIRDFLDHLTWELRNLHFENTAKQVGTFSKEASEMLGKYQKRYGQYGLMATYAIGDGMTEDDVAAFRAGHAEDLQQYIDAMETLQPLFAEADECIRTEARDGKTVVKIVSPSEDSDS